MQLFGLWVRWFLLTIVTLGIYGFWVAPRVHKWIVENTDFDHRFALERAFPTPPGRWS